LDALLEALDESPVRDLGRHLLLLSTIGEIRDGRATERLQRFISRTEPIFSTSDDTDRAPAGDERSLLDYQAVLQARAVEMLSYLDTPESRRATLRLAAEHPLRAVRAAAIDAHLYNSGDAPEAIRELLESVSADDATLVGLPRLIGGIDHAEFDRRVASFYARHPEEVAPLPERARDAMVEVAKVRSRRGQAEDVR
jgi:hypothetical protein